MGCGMAITKEQRVQFNLLVSKVASELDLKCNPSARGRIYDQLNVDAMTACVCVASIKVCNAAFAGKISVKRFMDHVSGIANFTDSMTQAGYLVENNDAWTCNFETLHMVASSILREITMPVAPISRPEDRKHQRRKRG